MVQFRPLFPELRHFEKNGTRHFFRSAAILKVLLRPNFFQTVFELVRALSERKPTCEFWSDSGWSQHKLAHSCQGRGQRSNGAINRNKHLFRSFCRGISLSNSGRVIPKRRYEMREREREREGERERERGQKQRVKQNVSPS